ncbi:hypothetical protein [Limnohabitans sp. DM1]|uniref:hypothetical protein n=1 Tax=Limnohabitans sp. DM1 TaxID=1597955 RepID=UPI000B076820|nr:hypothetical protein [Limnohabitans sp. DM1]
MDTPLTPHAPMLPILLAQASTPGPVTDGAVVSDAPASTAVSVQQGPRNVKVVESKEVDGTSSFEVAVTSSQVKSVQVLDLDMLLLLDNGDGILLREGAFLATTNAIQKVIFSNGKQMPVSELLQQVGVMKPSEAASFRISSTELTLVNNEPRGGQGLNLGKGDDDTQKGPAVEEVTQLLQSLQNAKLSDSPVAEQPIIPLKLADNLADPVVLRPASSPGTEFTTNNQSTSNLTALKIPSLTGAVDPKVSGVETADSTKTFAATTFDKMVGMQQLAVKVQANATSVAPPAANTNPDRASALLNLDAPSNATSLKVQLSTFGSAAAAELPERMGFTLNGQDINNAATVVVPLSTANQKLQLPVTWKLAEGEVSKVTFQMLVQYLDATGKTISGVDQTLTFQYQSINEVNQIYELDGNGNPILQLPANGFNYNITGRDADDNIQAWFGNDIVRGQGGNDVVDGGAGHDSLYGEAGNDSLIGGTGNDLLDGGEGNDFLNAGEGVNLLMGGTGDDTLNSGAASDTLDGGAGNDLLNAGEGVNLLTGGAGDDTLNSGAAHDTLDGGAGNDLLNAGGGDNSLVGGGGNDSLSAGSGNDKLAGGEGNDSLNAGDGQNTLWGGAGDDTMNAGSGHDTLTGDEGHDVLNAGGGDNSLVGGVGNDTLSAGNGNDLLEGGEDNDLLNAGDGQNTLLGGSGDDTLMSGAGHDLLIGGAGADVMDAGGGNNTVSFALAQDAVIVNLALGAGQAGEASGDTYTRIQNVVGSNFHDQLLGDAQNNLMLGGQGNDTLAGGGGLDTLVGGLALDALDLLPAEENTVSYETALQNVLVSLTDSNQNAGAAAGNVLIGIAHLLGGQFNDQLTGDTQSNRLTGGAGHDTLMGLVGQDTLDGGDGNDVLQGGVGDDALVGGAGHDLLDGGDGKDQLFGDAGDDTLIGGVGADLLSGGDGLDIASYQTALGSVTVNLAEASLNAGDDGRGDTLISIEGVIGSQFDDQLTGNELVNKLYGREGNDILTGGAGADTLSGGEGVDTAAYLGAASGVRASLTQPSSNTGDAQGDVLISIENLTGSAFADTLEGNVGANVLSGSRGDDVLIGRGGGDLYFGGDGSDTADYSDALDKVVINLANQENNAGAAAGDQLESIERVVGSRYNDELTGDAGDNALAGGEGSDTLNGGAGQDALDGGDGIDTATYAFATAKVEVSLLTGGTAGDAQGDTFNNIENLVGTNFEDKLEGNAANNVISGNAGGDTLVGGGGSDVFYGGEGDDVMRNTGNGLNQYFGGSAESDSGVDVVTYEGINTPVRVSLSTGGTNNATAGQQGSTETFSGIENLIGGTGNDWLEGDLKSNQLTGGSGDDSLYGMAGSDILLGGSGNDFLVGGAGNDLLNGGDGSDTVSYQNSDKALTIDMARTERGAGGLTDAVGDAFASIEVFVGSQFSDTFLASTASTWIRGGDTGATRVTDTVDYSASEISGDSLGVDVDLARDNQTSATVTVDGGRGVGGGAWEGGMAKGDSYDSIENIIGTKGHDVLAGDAQANKLEGGLGNDTLIGRGGHDTLDGGEGINTLNYAERTSHLLVNLGVVDGNGFVTVTLATGANAEVDLIKNIQNLVGGTGNDSLSGSAADNWLSGGAGNDSLMGLGGADTLDGDTGNDLLNGGDGNDSLMGGAGLDTLIGGAGADTLIGGTATDGSDTLNVASYETATVGVTASLIAPSSNTGDAQGDVYQSISGLRGSAFNDLLTGDAQDNTLDGGSGNDELDGRAGNDILVGGAGNDTFMGGEGADLMDGGVSDTTVPSVDVVTYANYTGATGLIIDLSNLLVGQGQGTDWAKGDVFSNIQKVIGTAKDDTFWAGSSPMAIDGGSDTQSGSNTVSFEASTSAGVSASLMATPGITLTGWAANKTYTNIQNLTGTTLADVLEGDAHNNVLSGGAGDDVFKGTLGNDTLIGGTGNDTADFSSVTSALNMSLVNGTVTGSGINTSLQSIEWLVGGSAADTLVGAAGNDILTGAGGADSYVGGDGTDFVNYERTGLTQGLTIRMDTVAGATSDAVGDTYAADIEGVIGTRFADNLYGRSTDEILQGGAGDDTLYGSLGADTLEGNSGTNTADYSASTAVNIDVSDSSAEQGGFAQGDQLSNIQSIVGSAFGDAMKAGATAMQFDGRGGNDTLIGGAGADRLDGGDGDDSLTGNAGNDILLAGKGVDTLSGGDGNDVLNFSDKNLTADQGSGGAGDDTFILGSSTGGSFVMDGGAGTDTLKLLDIGNTWSLDTTTIVDNKFIGFEKLDLSGNGNQNLTLTAQGIKALVDPGNSPLNLTLILDDGDTYSPGGDNTLAQGAGSFNLTGGGITAHVNIVYVT